MIKPINVLSSIIKERGGNKTLLATFSRFHYNFDSEREKVSPGLLISSRSLLLHQYWWVLVYWNISRNISSVKPRYDAFRGSQQHHLKMPSNVLHSSELNSSGTQYIHIDANVHNYLMLYTVSICIALPDLLLYGLSANAFCTQIDINVYTLILSC